VRLVSNRPRFPRAGLWIAGYALALALGCGYRFRAAGAELPGSGPVFVAPFANASVDADAGAWVGTALREELARRGREGGPGSGESIEGEVLGTAFGPSTLGGTYLLTLEVKARFLAGGAVLAEATVRRSEEYLGAVDALESEGRRRLALRRLSREVALELLERWEKG
jgi:hypothetical protein